MERPDHDFLTIAEAADFLRTSVPTLRRWTRDGKIPRAATPGRRPLYSRAALVALLTAEPPAPETPRPEQ